MLSKVLLILLLGLEFTDPSCYPPNTYTSTTASTHDFVWLWPVPAINHSKSPVMPW